MFGDPLFSFDPVGLPAGYVRFVRVVSTAGAIAFAILTVYCYLATSRALNAHVQDIEAMLVLMKAGFLFVLTAVSGAMALICLFISFRCWMAR